MTFDTAADNLDPGDTNHSTDVFVLDRQTWALARVSVSSGGVQGNFGSEEPSISTSGRYVAFQSGANNLVEGDTNGVGDIFVHDRLKGLTTLVSVSSSGTQATIHSARYASISAHGRYVAFQSHADDLVSGDTNGRTDVFVHDRLSGETSRVSVSSGGVEGNADSVIPSISGDGRYVAFFGYANNLVQGDTNGNQDAFVHDRETGQTTRVSVDSSGGQVQYGGASPFLSGDGRFAAFLSVDPKLVPGDSNGTWDVFVHDRLSGMTTRVSVSSSGVEGNGKSGYPSISADGQIVAFYSEADNLVAGDTNSWGDVFLHDRRSGMTTRMSVSSSGEEANWGAEEPFISADGMRVVFLSFSTNLVPNDNNNYADIFLRDCGYPLPTAYCTSKANSLGCVPAIDTWGAPGPGTGDDFQIIATDVLNNKFGVLMYGRTGAQALPFQGGFLCVAPPVRWTALQHSGGSPWPAKDCTGRFRFDFDAYISSGVDPALIPGQQVWAQYYSRDPGFAPPDNTNLTDALEFIIQP